jgi:hypothetical protein
VITALSEGTTKFVPDVLVTSGNGGGALDGLAAAAMHYLGNGGNGGVAGASAKPADSVASKISSLLPGAANPKAGKE